MSIVDKCKIGEIIKGIWRLYTKTILRKRNVLIRHNVRFNKKTFFEGYNRIGRNSKIGNAYIGRFSYLGSDCKLNNCKIGRFSSVGSFVEVIPWNHPSKTFISTSPVFFSDKMQAGITFVKNSIFNEHLSIEGYDAIIGNDVWIGDHVLIKGGIKIGDGAIIAFGSAVTRDVPPYAIVGGVPAKIIRYRFSPIEINQLCSLKWWNKDIEWLKRNVAKFSDISNINSL